MVTRDRDLFTREVPPPLHKFRGAPLIDPHNQWITSLDDDKKVISKAQYTAVKKTLDGINKTLSRADVDRMLATYTAIKSEYQKTLADWTNAQNEALGAGIPSLMLQGRIARQNGDIATEQAMIAQLQTPELGVILEKKRIIAGNLKSLYEDVFSLSQRIEPYRSLLARRAKLRQRLIEHETAKLDEKVRAKLRQEMAEEANYYVQLIIRHWARLGYCFRYTRKNKTITVTPKIERVIVTEDDIQIKILASRQGLIPGAVRNMLPNGVNAWDLVKTETLRELTIGCEREITSPHVSEEVTFANGAWLELHRLGLTDGLLDFVDYDQVVSRYEVEKREKMPIPMGVKRGRNINWINLAEHPHMLITGQNGSGKSNVINMVISTLISQHTPDEIRLIFIDLKEGVELGRFAKVPHAVGLLNDAIEKVPALMMQVETERMKRMKAMKALGVTNILEYNALMPHAKMPRLVIVFDEYGALLLDKKIKDETHNLTAQIAMKGRAAGVHLLLGTQTPYMDVMPNKVRANMTLQIGGKQATQGSSMSALGGKQAHDLPKLAGRMLCNTGTDEFAVQMPYISPEQIAECIARAETMQPSKYQFVSFDLEDTEPFEPIALPFDHERLAQIAIEQFDGRLSPDLIHKSVKDEYKVSVRQIRMLATDIISNNGIEINGTRYTLTRFGQGYKFVSTSVSTSVSTHIDILNSVGT